MENKFISLSAAENAAYAYAAGDWELFEFLMGHIHAQKLTTLEQVEKLVGWSLDEHSGARNQDLVKKLNKPTVFR